MTASRHALVAGASGLLGPHLVSHLSASPGWVVSTLSRREDGPSGAQRHLAADLLDPDRVLALADRLGGITHVFFCSRAVGANYAIDHDANVAMLSNLCDALARGGPRPLHVQLMHGLKWYGFNLAEAKIPGREDDPPQEAASFYAAQRALLMQRSAQNGWSWSTIRPHLVCGVATSSPSNIVSVIGTLGAVLQALGEPLWFPGPEAAYEAVINVTDIDLLTDAMAWAATTPACAGEDFNILNGDCFRWRDMWPIIAAALGMEPGPVRPTRLVDFMANKAAVWDRVARDNGLVTSPFAAMGDWSFADASFGLGWHQVAAVTKANRFGFTRMRNSEEMFRSHIAAYRQARLLP